MNNDQLSRGFSISENHDNEDGVSLSVDEDDDDDDNDSSMGDSSTNGSSSAHNKSPKANALEGTDYEIQRLAQRVMRSIRFWRVIILLFILSMGAGVAYASWVVLSAQEEDQYMEGYIAISSAVRDSSTFYVGNLLKASRNLAETITSYSMLNNETFPLVTIDSFETLARHAREQSGMESIVYSPLVRDADRKAWENYSMVNQGWIQQSIQQYEPSVDLVSSKDVTYGNMKPIFPNIYSWTTGTTRVPSAADISYAPYWHVSPFPSTYFSINANQLETELFDRSVFSAVSIAREAVFTQFIDLATLSRDELFGTDTHVAYHEQFLENTLNVSSALSTPHSYLVEPVFTNVGDSSALVAGYIQGLVPWDRMLYNVVPEGVCGVYVVLENSCAETYTYMLNGNKATFMGPGDLHDAFYDDTAMRIPLRAYIDPGITPTVPGHCEYTFITYSSAEYAGSDNSNVPTIVAASICIIFSFIALAFILYDCFIQRRNNIVLDTATKSHAILSSLFPSNVRDRLYAEKTGESASGAYTKGGSSSLKTLLNSGNMMGGASGEEDAEMGYKGKPIADLFTESTVLFADIAGFTAWSSVREPAQVFTLLESLYRAFDEIAKRRGVFKVETIGDCYVAVTGVPEPQKDHAVIMCRFARDMMNACRTMTKRLETKLGPDTGDLDMRVGIHSGPVTAGVLRGERSRFQLFGDTMNTASRTESTGLKGKIQLSQETADFLITAGKSYWIRQREEKVFAKGKGEMTTYWLSIKKEGNAATSSASDSGTVEIEDDGVANAESFEISHNDKRAQTLSSEKTIRLIEWNCDVLLRLIKQIAARRISTFRQSLKSKSVDEQKFLQSSTLAIDEVQEIVKLPEFDIKNGKDVDKDSIVLEPVVVEQLFDYVSNIAAMYRDNHFHNFEHASHVTMSVTKLLSRIVAPSHIDAADGSGKALHDHTYGITSDPLTQFACVFSALIHDVDHCGVPNAQLIKEHAQIAEYYQGKSVAEQNSVDIAWHLLMDDSYADLRKAIYTTNDEFQRFRQLVVNSVMATDIVDKELKTLRNKRWEKAFSETAVHENAKDSVDRKATIVIEHLIQASDVSHTMQHWHIYRKWNERFFMECYQADKDGRAENDPSESWYTGEIGFYDFYIIPLAKKLKDCGVFGVSSDEYLNYAQRNRSEWEARGQEVVQEMIEKAQNGIAKGSRITKNG